MSQKPSEGFGARLAKYRRLAGLSAQALSDAMGGEMSRGVIANIESGRKKDVTIDQLIALAYALDVPPVALALPIEHPYQFIDVYSGYSSANVRAHELANWFISGRGLARESEVGRPGYALASTTLRELASYMADSSRIANAEQRLREGDTSSNWRAILDEERTALGVSEARLADLGVDLTVHKVDD